MHPEKPIWPSQPNTDNRRIMSDLIQSEVNDLLRKLRRVSNTAKRDSQRAFKEAAVPLISAIRGRAPQSDEPHSRYSGGQIVATYYPGNLRRAFRTLTFRRSAAVFVGPKLDKGGAGGEFRGARADAYYAHWIEFGAPAAGLSPRPFVKPAVDAAGGLTLRLATEFLKRKIEAAV